jgi:hypothetical protein
MMAYYLHYLTFYDILNKKDSLNVLKKYDLNLSIDSWILHSIRGKKWMDSAFH